MEIKFYRTQGDYGFMSNFYKWPIAYCGYYFNTSEHFYQALKFGGWAEDSFKQVLAAKTARDAARLGRTLHGVRADWNLARDDVMRLALLLKFEPEYMRSKLLATDDATLIEDTSSSGDAYWGQVNGVGENRLGKLLMETRSFYAGFESVTRLRERGNLVARYEVELLKRLIVDGAALFPDKVLALEDRGW